MKLAPGLKVNLFASEKEFPDLAKPVQMAWDPRTPLGRCLAVLSPLETQGRNE